MLTGTAGVCAAGSGATALASEAAICSLLEEEVAGWGLRRGLHSARVMKVKVVVLLLPLSAPVLAAADVGGLLDKGLALEVEAEEKK